MKTSQRMPLEDVLWDIARETEADCDAPVPPDEILEAYRAGRLSPDEASRLEALLAHSRSARQQLAAFVGVEGPEPAATVREKVLAEFVRLSRARSASEDGVVTACRGC